MLRAQGVANRDIKLENTLLDDSERPLLKICDFGYSKVCFVASAPARQRPAVYAFACCDKRRTVAEEKAKISAANF